MSNNNTTPVSLDALAVGRSSTNPFITVFSQVNPTVNDVNYPIQTRWFNQMAETEYILTSFSVVGEVKTAVWQPINASQVAAAETLTGNSGGAVAVDGSNNINVIGDATTINIAGNPGTHTLTASVITTLFFTSVKNRVFTTTGTYTPTTGMLFCSIQCLGGGGAGGGAPSTTSSQAAAGGGGGGGEYAVGIFSAATIGASKPVTIGAGGTGSTGGGGSGGTTSVGSLITAVGGSGGQVGVADALCIAFLGGNGGTGGTGGDYRTPGSPGGWSQVTIINPGYISTGGIGAPSQLGGGGNLATGAGNAGVGYGSGGAGASNIPGTVSASNGGNGAPGIVVITEYI